MDGAASLAETDRSEKGVVPSRKKAVSAQEGPGWTPYWQAAPLVAVFLVPLVWPF